MLVVAIDERRAGNRRLPPGDAPHADRADAPDDADLSVAQPAPDDRAEVRVDDLRVLMNEHERLELVAVG